MQMMKLEELQADATGLAETLARVSETRLVSRADVAPYIQHFPMTVSLNSFSQEPSGRNVDIALEGFAAMFKVAAAVALVGVVGVCIYNFIRSRKTKDTANTAAESASQVSKTLLDLQSLVATAPGYLQQLEPRIGSSELPRGTGVTLLGEICYQDFAREFFSDGNCNDLRIAAEGLAALIAYGEFASVSDSLLTPLINYMGDLTRRVQELRKILNDMPGKLNAGHIDQTLKALSHIDLRVPRGALLSVFGQYYDKRLPSPKSAFQPNSAGLFDDRVQALGALVEEVRKGTSATADRMLEDFRNGALVGPVTRLREISLAAMAVDHAPTNGLSKNLVHECEELKKKIEASEFTEEVDKAFKEVLEEIRLDSVASAALMDLVGQEQRLITSLLLVMLKKVAQHAGAVAVFTKPTDSSRARKLAQAAADAGKLAMKVKL